MGFEGVNNQERISKPEFQVTISRDSESEKNSLLLLTYGHLGFEVSADLTNGKLLNEPRLVSDSIDESQEHVDRMRQHAFEKAKAFAFEHMMQDFE